MRPTPTRGAARVTRGLVAASVCALLTYSGHVTAGGATADLGLLVVLALLLGGFLVVLADRRRGPLAILALVSGAQLALHGLLQLLGTGHVDMSGTGLGSHPAQTGPGAPVVELLGAHPALMLGAHALATLATSAILAGAEDAVFAVAAALARALPRLSPAPPVPEPPSRPLVLTGPLTGRLRGVLGRRLYLRRGPPSTVAVVGR